MRSGGRGPTVAIMARVSYVHPQTAPPETARALERLPDAHVFGLVAHARTAFVPWLRLGGAILNDLALPASLRELVILQVGRLAQRYEWVQHVPLAQAAGITDRQIAALESGDTTGPFDEVQRAVLSFPSSQTWCATARCPTPTSRPCPACSTSSRSWRWHSSPATTSAWPA